MKNFVVAAAWLVSIASPAFANGGVPATLSLRQIVDEVADKGSAVIQNGDTSVRLVRDAGECRLGEKLTPIWINFFDSRQHLSGYTCQTVD